MSGMVEYRFTCDLQAVRKQVITTNFAEVNAWIEELRDQHCNVVVTEDTIQEAKQTRANLRKVQENIRQVRREGRAAALAACAELEENCKDLEAKTEVAVQNYDVQIKAFEARRKEEKAERLKTYFDRENELHNTKTYLTWERVLDPKWLNATASEDAAEKAIDAIITDTVNGIAAIVTLQSPFEVELLDHYRETHDVSAVLVKNETLCRMKAIEEERKRKEAEATAKYAAALEELKRVADETMRQAEQKASETGRSTVETLGELSKPVNDLVDEDGHEMPAAQEPEYKVDFRVFGTARQLDGLKSYMQSSGIRFMPVPQE